MATFSSVPPEDPRGNALPLVRTGANAPLCGVITTDDIIGTYTHYWHGRTTPHDNENCEPCQKGMPFRWHAWFGAIAGPNQQPCIVEITRQAAQQFVDYRKSTHSLRGTAFKLWRPSKKINGRVFVQMKPADLTRCHMPDPPDIVAALSIIWNIAQDDLKTPDRIDGIERIEALDRMSLDPGRPSDNGRKPLHA